MAWRLSMVHCIGSNRYALRELRKRVPVSVAFVGVLGLKSLPAFRFAFRNFNRCVPTAPRPVPGFPVLPALLENVKT